MPWLIVISVILSIIPVFEAVLAFISRLKTKEMVNFPFASMFFDENLLSTVFKEDEGKFRGKTIDQISKIAQKIYIL